MEEGNRSNRFKRNDAETHHKDPQGTLASLASLCGVSRNQKILGSFHRSLGMKNHFNIIKSKWWSRLLQILARWNCESCERESTSIEHRAIQTLKSKHPILFSYAFTVIYPQSKQTDQNHRPGHGLNSSLPLATSPFVVCLVPPISSQFAPLTHHLLDLHPMICHPGFGAPGGSWMGSTEYLE